MEPCYGIVEDLMPPGPRRLVRSVSGAILELPDRWYLDRLVDRQGDPLEEHELLRCRPFEKVECYAVVMYPGTPLDVSFTATNVPVVSERVATYLREAAPADVDLFPAGLVGSPGTFYVVNVLSNPDCLEVGTTIRGEWLDRGNPPSETPIPDVLVDPARTGGAMLFRPYGREEMIVIAQPIKLALEQMAATGLKYQQISP
jgi:hypothetical protein